MIENIIICPRCSFKWKAPGDLLQNLMRENIVSLQNNVYVGLDYICRGEELSKIYPKDWIFKEELPDDCMNYFAPAIVGLLSDDFTSYGEVHGSDPHCYECINPDCENAGRSGDDACASGFVWSHSPRGST